MLTYQSLISGNTGTTYTRQSASNLQIGLTYNVSVDLKVVVNPQYSIVESCYVYMYHDSLTTNTLIAQSLKQYTRANTAWTTYGGTVTPTSTDMEIGIVLSCSPYHSSTIFNAYLDNAIMQGKHLQPSLSPGIAPWTHVQVSSACSRSWSIAKEANFDCTLSCSSYPILHHHST